MSLLIKVLCAAMLFASSVAFAQQTDRTDVALIITQAQKLYDANEYYRAIALLENVIANTDQEKTEILFITGLSALNAAVPLTDSKPRNALLAKAVESFYEILVNHPQLARVRLELARAFFEQGNDDLAKEEFERVLSGDVPPNVTKTIQQFLSTIRSRRRWNSYLQFSVVPESRVEQNRTILLNVGGELLPFTLNDAPDSGPGLDVSTGGTYDYPLSGKWSLISGVNVRRLEYAGHRFDRTELEARLGPKITFSQGNDLYLNASFQSNYREKDKHTSNVREINLSGNRAWSPRFSTSSAVSIANDNNHNGQDDSFSLSGKYRFSPTIFGSSTVILARTMNHCAVGVSRYNSAPDSYCRAGSQQMHWPVRNGQNTTATS